MSEPFLGELKIVSFNFPPKGWAFCNGQFMSISQNQALFALLGTMYGGNGQTTFALPDLRGRAPIHVGGVASNQGQQGGSESATITLNEMPAHIHAMQASNNDADSPVPNSAALGNIPVQAYRDPASLVAMSPGSVNPTGGSQPHTNMQPYLVLNFIIALGGIFPSRN
jgi:microcystin-dependent protein